MKKLGLKKKIISSLSDAEMAKVNGGLEEDNEGTTSFRRCSRGFICCGSTDDIGCGTSGSFVSGCPSVGPKCIGAA